MQLRRTASKCHVGKLDASPSQAFFERERSNGIATAGIYFGSNVFAVHGVDITGWPMLDHSIVASTNISTLIAAQEARANLNDLTVRRF